MEFRRLGTLSAAALFVAAACSPSGASKAPSSSGGATKGTIKIGVELPISGGEAPNGEPTRNGVLLAVKEANTKGGVAGYTIDTNIQDDAVNGKNNPDQGAKNMGTLAADAAVVGVVGPYNSAVAKAQIPISNEAGLLQCSPANTNFSLTIPEYGAKDLRPKNPDKIAYVRVATTDLSQGAAGAGTIFTDLGKKNLLIIDDQTTFGKGIADVVEKTFKELGGTVVERVGADKSTTDFTGILSAAKAKNPDALYYGGVTTSGAGLLRKQMPGAGLGDLPFVGPDGINDGDGTTAGSFINISGAASANSYSTVAAIHDIPNAGEFAAKYKAEYGKDPGSYSAAAYACTQVMLKAVEASAASATDMKALREAVRAFVTGGTTTFETVLGPIKFDANGDTSQHVISFYKVDSAAAGGKGDWAFTKQQDFGTK